MDDAQILLSKNVNSKRHVSHKRKDTSENIPVMSYEKYQCPITIKQTREYCNQI